MDNKFLIVFNSTKHDIYRLVRTYMKNSFDTDDIVQNVYLKLYKNIDNLNDADHAKHWLIRVAVNECKNHFLSNWMRRIVPLGDSPADEISFGTDSSSQIWHVVKELPKKYRIVIYLFYYEGYSTSGIAETLRLREATVRKQLQRGRDRLRTTLREALGNEK